MGNRGKNQWIQGSANVCLVVSLLAATSIFWSRGELRRIQASVSVAAESPPLYLPEIEKVRMITLGFDNFAADILWFNTLNYFGKQMATERDYRWLGHMCQLVTDLNPKTRPIIEFCSTMLSWVADQKDQSTIVLKKAIAAEPNYWRHRYLLGFNYWYFHEDFQAAGEMLQSAAQLPNSPPFVASLAARITLNESSPQMAISFLQNLIKREPDRNAKAALEEKLKLAIISLDLERLQEIANRYEKEKGKKAESLQEIVEAELLPHIPFDPFGDIYVINPETLRPDTSSSRKGLDFPGKTARTGLASKH